MGDPARAVAARLRHMGAGLLAMLNVYAFRLAKRDFPHLLVEDPLTAYKVLLEYTRGDTSKARYLMVNLLVGLVGSPRDAEEAVTSLEKGDPEPLRKLLQRMARKGRRGGLL